MNMNRIGLVLAAIALIAAACSGSGEQASYKELADVCDPKIEAAIQTWADAGLSGSITVMGGTRECSIGFGIADRETGREIKADTAFAIGSITKAVTAAAILQLVDDGVLTLEDTASQHVPELTGPARDLVIRDLILHTSGLVGYHGQDHVPMTKGEAHDAISTLDVVARGKYIYTNSGYALLGLIIEAVTDEGYRQYVADNILRDGDDQPIGGFWDGEPATPGPRAYGYRSDGSRGQIGEFEGPFWTLEANGGIGMTTLEMAEWARALWTGKILSPEATEMLTTVRHQTEFGIAELPGWGEQRIATDKERVYSTSGGGGSISHNMDTFWLPDTDRVFVMAVSATTEMTRGFASDLVLPLRNGTGIPSPIPIVEADQALTDRMVGQYQLDGSDELVTISQWENGLNVQAGGVLTQELLFPLPAGMESEAERHEAAAVELINSDSLSVQTELQYYETEIGAIEELTLIGTTCCSMLTMFEVQHDDGTTGALGITVVNGAIDDGRFGHLTRFVVYDHDGTYYGYRPNPGEVFQVIPSSDDTIQIVGSKSTATATKVE